MGAMNHKFFCLFLLYTAGTCLLSLLLLVIRVFHCGYLIDAEEKEETFGSATGGRSHERGEHPSSNRFLEEHGKTYRYGECNDFYASHLVVGLLIASLVFLVFTCAMGCEQLEAIETGKSKIAQMKVKVGQAGTEFKRATEEFNEMFGGHSPKVGLHWFWPRPISFPSGMRKVVLGYEWDPSFDLEPYESDSNASDRELDDLENGKAVSRVPSTVEGDGLVNVPSADDISLSDVSINDDNPYLKNRKISSRQDTNDSESVVSLPRIT